MRLLRHIAQRIVNEVSKVIEEEVIVMNDEGVIIAASDSSRVGSFHQVGKEVVIHGKKQMITESDSKKYKGVKMGLNLPTCKVPGRYRLSFFRVILKVH